jgi:tetratricopeptide (TPR) repeat protein
MLHELLEAKLKILDAASITILQYISLSGLPIEEAIIYKLIKRKYYDRIITLIKKNLVKEIRTDNKISIMLSSNIIKKIIDKKLNHIKKRSLAGNMLPVVEQFANDNAEYYPLLADLASIASIKNKAYIYTRKAAETKEKSADLELALVYYKKAVAAAGPDRIDESYPLLMKIGEIEDRIGNIDSALKAYLAVLSQPVNNNMKLKALYNTGLAYQTQGQHTKAQDFFRESLKLVIDDKTKQVEIMNHLSYSMMCMQDHEEAQKLLSKSLSLIDETKEPALYAETKYLTAVLDWYRHEYEKGILTMKQVIEGAHDLEKHVSVITFYNLLGLFYQQKNDFDKAERTYSDALKIISSSINIPVLIGILVNLAMINKNQRKHDKAKQFLDKALGQARKIGNRSTIASILASMANIAEVTGQLDKAIEINKEAMHHDPELAVIRQNLAMLYCKKCDFKNAETILGAIEQRPHDIPHNMTLAVLYASCNAIDKAKPLVEQSLATLGNADVEIYRKIGCHLKASDIYYSAQCYVDCLRVAHEALKIVPPDSREYYIVKATVKLCEYLTGKVEKVNIDDCKELLKESGCVYDWIMLNRMEAEAKCMKNDIQNNASFVNELTDIEEMCKSIGAANELARISKVKEACYRITQQPIPKKSLTVQYLNVFSKISDAVVDHLGEDSFVDELLEVVLQATQAERGALFLIDKSKTLLLGCKNIDNETIDDAKRLSRSVIRESAKKCEAVIVTDALNSPVHKNAKSVILNRIRSILCVPFVLSTRFKGAIYLDSRFTPDLFS